MNRKVTIAINKTLNNEEIKRIELLLKQEEGVKRVKAAMRRKSIKVSLSASRFDTKGLLKILEEAGFKGFCALDELGILEARPLIARLLGAAAPLLALIILANAPYLPIALPYFLQTHRPWFEILLALMVFFISGPLLKEGFATLFKKPGSQSLAAFCASGTLLYSLTVLLMEWRIGSAARLPAFYFQNAALIMWLELLAQTAKRQGLAACMSKLKKAAKTLPHEVLIEEELNGAARMAARTELEAGWFLPLQAGQAAAADAIIEKGSLTLSGGPFAPKALASQKRAGDFILAGEKIEAGQAQARIQRPANRSALSLLIDFCRPSGQISAAFEKRADSFMRWQVPIVLTLSVAYTGLCRLQGMAWNEAAFYGVGLLAVLYTGYLSLGMHAVLKRTLDQAADYGIYIKNSRAVEDLAELNAIVFSQPEALLESELKFRSLIALRKQEEPEAAKWAAACFARRQDAYARAFMRAYSGAPAEADQLQVQENGLLTARAFHKKIALGPASLFNAEDFEDLAALEELARPYEMEGALCLCMAVGGRACAALLFQGRLRPQSAQAAEKLEEMRLRVSVLSDTSQKSANAIAREAGIINAQAGVSRAMQFERLEKLGKPPARLAFAHSSGLQKQGPFTRICLAQNAVLNFKGASAVLMRNSLLGVAQTVALCRRAQKAAAQNYILACFVLLVFGAWVLAAPLLRQAAFLPLIGIGGGLFGNALVWLNAQRLRVKN